MKSVRLNVHSQIPLVGLGTWELKGEVCYKTVSYALDIGYRHIDTADIYDNHVEVGRAINDSDVPRDKVFLTTKVWRSDLRYDEVIKNVHRFLEELQSFYIDLLLIHWPNRSIPVSETLKAFDDLMSEGLIKAIGVSNFTINHLHEALKTGVEISNNQVEFHPSLYQKDLKSFCDQNNIVLTAYSPVAQGRDLKLSEVLEISERIGKTPSQVVLKWMVKKNIAVIPRSSSNAHIKENFELFDWDLSEEDVNVLDHINKNNRIFTPHFHEFH